MQNYKFRPDETDDNLRLDTYLSSVILNISREKIKDLIKSGKATVFGMSKRPSYKVGVGDEIFVEIEDTDFGAKPKVLPENLPLNIIWEDENMLVVNKPSGMLTHPSANEQTGTLVNALLNKYGEDGLSNLNGLLRLGIVHRLDRNTSGLLMVAKNNKTHEFLAKEIKERNITKKYLAIVKGVISQDEGILDFPIGRNPKNPTKMCVCDEGKPSLTEFKVLNRFKEATFLELNLKTGRTHQIRVHLSHIHHPIINDTLYGSGKFKVKTQEQVLQSYKLSFTKPFSCDTISLEIEPDEKITKVLRYLDSNK